MDTSLSYSILKRQWLKKQKEKFTKIFNPNKKKPQNTNSAGNPQSFEKTMEFQSSFHSLHTQQEMQKKTMTMQTAHYTKWSVHHMN